MTKASLIKMLPTRLSRPARLVQNHSLICRYLSGRHAPRRSFLPLLSSACFTATMASSSNASDHDALTTSRNKHPLNPQKFPISGFEELDPSVDMEEETLSYYDPTLFYPVQIGDVLYNRYQAIAKFGFGSTSTTWLCKDLVDHRHVVLKVYIRHHSIGHNLELECFRHIQGIEQKTDHPGRRYIRFPEDHFTIQGQDGAHEVFVLRPLGLSVRAMQSYIPSGVFPELNAVLVTKAVVAALEFLHLDANLIHCDVHSGNLLLTLSNESVLDQFEKNELVKPTPRKLAKDGRIIHVTQYLLDGDNPPVLCDFSGARICTNDDESQRGLPHMPEHYRPPEVILDMPWSYPVDMWCLGLTIWRMLSTKSLFGHYNGTDLDEARHLSLMVGLLGPPPLSFLKKSEKALKYWDSDGKWKGPIPLPPPTHTLEALCPKSLQGKAKVMFLDFMRKILHWDPEERLYPGSAWHHPWVHREVENDGLVSVE
ncbi:hypothetical protein ACKVWC_001354 [Pyricularia oryzae]